jgi:hypothetical protein
MFSEKEIKFMQSININVNFDTPTDDDMIQIETVVGDYLTLNCLDENYIPNSEGNTCYSILEKVA